MDAPPIIDPAAYSYRDVVHWLTSETRDERFIDNIFAELCMRLQRAGIPVKRASLHLLIQHPQWLGARIFWADGMREATITRVDYDVRQRSEYIGSPVEEIQGGATSERKAASSWSLKPPGCLVDQLDACISPTNQSGSAM